MKTILTSVAVIALLLMSGCGANGSAPGTPGYDHFAVGPLGRGLEYQNRMNRAGGVGRGYGYGRGRR